jgi:hypothetical protein
MGTRIIVEAGGRKLPAELSDSPAGRAVAAALPLTARMSRWGDEYYGDVGLEIAEDGTGRELMEVGEIAYWPPGKALCLFFGRTPASTDDRPRAASAVLPVGRVTADLDLLKGMGSSVKVIFRGE